MQVSSAAILLGSLRLKADNAVLDQSAHSGSTL